MTIPTLINECMKERGLNQLQFTKYLREDMQIKVRHNTVGYWIEGKYNPSIKILVDAIRTYPITDPRGLLARRMAVAMDLPELAGELEPTPSNSVPAESQN